MTRWQTVKLLLWGALRNLKGEEKLEEFCAEEFEVDLHRPALDIVIDGEIERLPTPLTFRVEKAALKVLVPFETGAA